MGDDEDEDIATFFVLKILLVISVRALTMKGEGGAMARLEMH